MAPDDELKFVEFFAPAYYVCDASLLSGVFYPLSGDDQSAACHHVSLGVSLEAVVQIADNRP